MKKGQLMSQPFFYIFAIVAIGLIVIFGFFIVNRLVKTGCQVENREFVRDLQDNIDEIYSIGFAGSSKECDIVTSNSLGDSKCKLVLPEGIQGMCFVDATKSLDYSGVSIKKLREELESLNGDKDRNVWFLARDDDCELNSIKLNKVIIPESICVTNKAVKILIENNGREVEISEV